MACLREDSKESCFLRAAAIFLDSLDWKALFFHDFRDFRDLEASRLPAGAGMPTVKNLLSTRLKPSSGEHTIFIATCYHKCSSPGSADNTNRETQRPSDFGHWAFVFCGIASRPEKFRYGR